MTRSPLSIFLVGAVGLSLAACGSSSLSGGDAAKSSSAPAATQTADAALVAKLPAKIKSAGTIVVGTDATYAPNEYLDTDGKTVVGMDVDIFNAIAAKFGLKVEYQPAKFDSIILGVSSGKYDVGLSSFTINDTRKTQATMVSYFNAGTQWVTPKGNPKKVDPENACGLNVGVQKGTVQETDDLPARSKKCTDAGKPAINPVVDEDQGKVTTAVISGKAELRALCDDMDQRCVKLLVLQAPVATDLRILVAAMHAVGDVERMCNLAQHIAKIARMKHPTVPIPDEVRPVFARMGVLATSLAQDAATAIECRDPVSADRLTQDDEEVDALRRRTFPDPVLRTGRTGWNRRWTPR